MKNESKNENIVTISPSFRLPLILIVLSFLPLLVNVGLWPTIIFSSFSFFLLIQTFTLRIMISETDFIVTQLGKEIRRFPFKNWLAWKLFLPKLPGIFYFREKVSPHLLPIIFNPDELREELVRKVKELEINKS
tara:strand:- start:1568 stop:1969 length:402 start_codon:yes stop_codon:yes gene_type:complete